MKIICKILCIGLFVFSNQFLFAHNSEHTRIKLIISEKSGFLDINLSQDGIEKALLKKYPNLELSSTATKDFKELIINYLKDNISLLINDQQLRIGTGIIKLGAHETSLKFKIENFPKENFKNLEIKAPCFKENEKQQTFFSVINNGIKANANLNKSNNFNRKFVFKENAIITIPDKNTKETDYPKNETLFSTKLIWMVPVFIIFSIIVFKFLKQKSFEKTIQSS